MRSPRLPQSTPGRIAAIVGAAVLLVLILSQIFLPGIGEGVIEDRLTENGGVADASLSATPAVRLLWGNGDSVKIEATSLDLEVSAARDPVVFDDLDRFDDVEIVMHDSTVGPIDLDEFVLTRQGDEPYSLEATGTTSPSELAEFGADSFDVPGSDIIGGILSFATGGAEADVELDMLVESDDGRVHVIEGGGEVAGIPTGPLAGIITSAIKIEI